jgi:hypothetical protein
MDVYRYRGRWQRWALGPLVLLAACGPLIQTEQPIAIADGKGATLDLLTPSRRLPASATNITGILDGFQDPFLQVRFDLPAGEASAFQSAMLEGKGRPCELWRAAKIEGWPSRIPIGGQCLEDNSGGGEPPIAVLLEPRGARTRVYLTTFRT